MAGDAGSANAAVPGPETCSQLTVTAAGGSGKPSSETSAARTAVPPMSTTRFGPASTTGAALEGGPPSSVYSTWSRGAPPGDPSNDDAIRWPDPVITTAKELAGVHWAELTTSWITVANSGVRCSTPAAPTFSQADGFHSTLATVTGRLERSPSAVVNTVAGPS